MIVLGIDPGTGRMGYGVVRLDGPRVAHVEHGCFETAKGMPQADRLAALDRRLAEIMSRHTPGVVGIEKLFFQKNAKTAMTVSEARGVALLAATRRGAEILERTPMEVKQAVTGYGGADKRQVQLMIMRLLALKEVPRPDDAADALAIAYCAAVSLPVVR